MATGDVKEDAHRQEGHDEARAAVGEEGKRDPGQRREPEDGREVDHCLAADERDETGCEPLPEGVLAGERDAKTGVGEGSVRRDHRGDPEQAELLPDHRHDHVRVRLGQVVDLRDALAETGAEQPARPEPDQRLHGLEARSLRVLPRVEEAEDARAAVRLEPDRDQPERHGDPGAGAERRQGGTRDQEDSGEDDDDRDHRP
jgi:hypothetical protein